MHTKAFMIFFYNNNDWYFIVFLEKFATLTVWSVNS